MDLNTSSICFLLLLFNFIEATNVITNVSETILDELRQARVSGRIVKLYTGSRPEPVYCPQEGFQPDPVDCAVFYRCVKGANNKYTVFRFQCGPGTVFDPDTKVCNFPRSTKRSECGGVVAPNEQKNENDIEGAQHELPSPISVKPIYTETTPKDSSTYSTVYPWATPKPQNIQSSSSASTVYAWMTTDADKRSPTKGITTTIKPSRQEGNQCTTDGFMGDSENCRKFYRCVGDQRGGFIRYEFSCSESTVWDQDVQSCNHPWAVKRSGCGSLVSDVKPANTIGSSNNEEQPTNTVQQQLQINYGDKVTQTQTQISYGSVTQNQTQINYGDRDKKQQSPQSIQNQTQISHGSAVSQTQTQINYGNGVQTQLQVDHSKDASQSQVQLYETSSKSTTSGTPGTDQGYGQQTNPEDSGNQQDNANDENECNESGFMGDKNDCKKFYRCVDNGRGGFIKYEFSCGEGTLWDSSIEACNHAWAVKECGGKTPEHSSPSTSTSTSTTKTTTQNYQTTLSPTKPEDNEDTGYGNQNQEAEITSTISTTQSKPVTIAPTEASNSDDICKSTGFTGDSKDCKKFYRCVDNGKGSYTKYEFKCGEGTVWDPEIEACNHAWAVNKCGGSSTDINKIETTEATAITTVTLIQTTQTSSQNADYDSGYGQQENQSPSTSTTTTTKPSSVTATSSEGTECKSSGFMGDTNDCKKFYRCVDNGNGGYTRYEFSCGEGTVWDPKIEACNHAWAVEKCGGGSSGDINNETTTSSRPIMSDEETIINDHNQTDQLSSTSSTTEQPNTTVLLSSGNECAQEGFMGDNKDCKKFYRCVDNGRGGFIKYEFSCGEGTVWDSEINSCNHASSVKNCGSDSTSPSQNISESPQESTTDSASQTMANQNTEDSKSTEKPPATKPSSDNDCTNEGFIGDNTDCKKFYRCVDNGQGGFIKYEFSCGEGTVWDPDINTCNHPVPDKRCGSTGSQASPITEPNQENDEAYTETNTGTSSSATEKDQQNQVTTSSQRPQHLDDKCVSEGFFSNSVDCKKFYRCVDNGEGGYTKYEFSCGDGTIWDQEIQACNHESSNPNCSKSSGGSSQTESIQGTTQVSSTISGQDGEQSTQTPEPPKESSSKCTSEGFYANPDDCKKFYRCVSNDKGGYTKYDFSCGEGTVWVQEILACDHDDGETSCNLQSESLPTSESNEQQSSTSPSNTSSTSSTQKPETVNDENPDENSNASPTPAETSDKCTSEGFYPNKKDCKRFYRCVDNGNGGYTKYDFTCGDGTAWDNDIQTCNHISEVKSCQGSNQEDNQSQPVQNDDAAESSNTTTTSSSESSSSTTESSKPSNKDTCEQEGYFGNTQDCTKFYRCVDNGKGGLTKYDFDCGEGTIWDQDVTTCNHPQDVTNPSCQKNDNNAGSNQDSSTTSSSSSSSTSESSSMTESSNNTSDCSQGTTKKPESKNVNCTKVGYYPDPNDCKKFYRCVDWDGDGKKFSVYHFECGEGTIWDPALDTCNHEDSVYPPRDCNGGTQSQAENVNQESTTEESSSTDDTTTTEQTSTQELTTSEQTTQQSSSEQTTEQQTTSEHTTTEQLTTSEHTTTEETTTQQSSEEQTTTQQSTTEHSTTEQTSSEHTTTNEQTTQEQTTAEQTTTEKTTTSESTTQQSDSSTTESDQQGTTEQSTTQQSTTEQSTDNQTEESSTTEGTTSMTTDSSTTESSEHSDSSTTESQQESTTESQPESTTTDQQESTTEDQQESTTEDEHESTTENGQESTTESEQESTTESEQASTTESEQDSTTESEDQTTESSSSSNKDCPETEDDQNLFVCPTSFRRHPKYCNMFYQCTEDDDSHDVQIATFRCPNNTIYDESKTKCVEEKKADKKCDGEIAQNRRVKRLNALHKEPIVVSNERLKCPTVGHFPFEKELCSPAFLKCETAKSGKIRGFVYQCPQGYVYWSVSRRCEPKSYLSDCKQSYNDWSGRWEIPIERRNVAP